MASEDIEEHLDCGLFRHQDRICVVLILPQHTPLTSQKSYSSDFSNTQKSDSSNSSDKSNVNHSMSNTNDSTIDSTNDPTIDSTNDPTIDSTNDPTIDSTIQNIQDIPTPDLGEWRIQNYYTDDIYDIMSENTRAMQITVLRHVLRRRII